jgi:small-conductance mechanosensitive channel
MNEVKTVKKPEISHKKPIIITFFGSVIMILLITATLEISHRNLSPIITANQRYIVSIESILLIAFMVEMFARLATLRSHTPQMIEYGARLRLMIRIIGYSIGSLSVVSILASNATLGISVGAIAGVVIAFATQNILSSVLAAVLILSTRIVKVGEQITIGQTQGIVADINMTHVVLSVEGDVVYVPNSLVMSSIVRRKKRDSGGGTTIRDW